MALFTRVGLIARTRPASRHLQFYTHRSNPTHHSTTMPSIQLHRRSTAPHTAATDASCFPITNPLPQLLQTPSGLALLELQGTINLPEYEQDTSSDGSSNFNAPSYETPIGKIMFPDYSMLNPDDTKWMKRAYLYVGRYQRMTGEVKKLPRPIAVLQKRAGSSEAEELEVVEIVRYKVFFKNRPEPVNDI